MDAYAVGALPPYSKLLGRKLLLPLLRSTEVDKLEMLPYDSLIEEGRYAGGHVIMLHADNNTYLFAVPPEAILLLSGMLPDEQYRELLGRMPSLASIVAGQRIKTS